MAGPVPVDCYAVLGVGFGATAQEINTAYKKLALKYHPDKCGETDSDRFRDIAEAAEVLRDPHRRLEHDQSLGYTLYPKQTFHKYNPRGERPPDHRNNRHYDRGGADNIYCEMGRADERYMHSYGSSVHMDPHSEQSKEESACKAAAAEAWAAEYAEMQAEHEAEMSSDLNDHEDDVEAAPEAGIKATMEEEDPSEPSTCDGVRVDDPLADWDNSSQPQFVTAIGPLAPFVPYFNARLNDPNDMYTMEDMFRELHCMLFRIYVG
ncbi:DnaJ-domain-containing protein [Penicillium argentinense]|uniref:DnaJ-domain-containing protein n=1 Tax=Penicillium argentinense TaxID=1131581 RepID=A0A9W9JY05_9EURO|nr:DnaJ-domain-containing protein [Penicillium argentinense]KAJ5086084.1 DnaJ-domain-containing protein [Penicillium argentinense]